MSDPQKDALVTLDGLLRRANKAALGPSQCMEMVENVRLVPGYLKRVAHALSAQRSAAAVEALLTLPPGVPGVVEGLHQALSHGVTRLRIDGAPAVPMLAMDFRRSRAKNFSEILARIGVLFGDGFETFRVDGKTVHRFVVWGDRGTLAGRAAAAAHDLRWVHERLAKLKGTRLWLNGWAFASEGPFSAPIQVHLVRAWLTWAATQTQTRGR